MSYRKRLEVLYYLSNKELLLAKMRAVRQIALLKATKLGIVAFMTVLLAQVSKSIFEFQGETLTTLDMVSIPVIFYCGVGYMVFNLREARFQAELLAINDILVIRSSNAKIT